MNKGDRLKKNMKNRQMRKVSLKFWNNMIVISIFMLFLLGNISSADTAQNEVLSTSSNEYISSDVELSLTDANEITAYNVVSVTEPNADVIDIKKISSYKDNDYEVKSDYNILTESGPMKVTVTNQINVNTGEVRFISKKIFYDGVEILESANELCIVSNGVFEKISVVDKDYANKFVINSMELLAEKSIVERPFFKSKREFVVMTDKEPDFEYERK